jgi:hypothetical protein
MIRGLLTAAVLLTQAAPSASATPAAAPPTAPKATDVTLG